MRRGRQRIGSAPACTYDVLVICSFNPSITLFTAYMPPPVHSLNPPAVPTVPLCFDAYNLGSGRILPAEHPHEDKLHHVAVEEEELCSPISLRTVDRLHAACWGRRRGVRQEDVLEGTELVEVSALPLIRIEGVERGKKEGVRLTRKKALAKNVYVKTVHPTHPPVPFPPFNISATTRVTITPTNLYPEYATRSSNWLSLLMLNM